MNILITGGTGLIGRALCRALELHHQLTVLTRRPYEIEPLMSPYVELVDSLDKVNFNQIDVVINLAGEPIADKRWTKRQKHRIEQSRWELTQAVVDKIQAADTPPGLLISGSAIGYYGRQSAENIDEDFTNASREYTHYLCKQWEQIAQSAASVNTRVVTLRTGIVLSHKGGALARMLPAFRMGLGGPISNGKQFMSWIHIDDMVRLIEFVISNETLSGAVNAVAPNPVTNSEFSKVLADSLNRPCLFRTPALLLRLLFGEMADLITTGQHVIPRKAQRMGFGFKYENLPDALRDINRSLYQERHKNTLHKHEHKHKQEHRFIT